MKLKLPLHVHISSLFLVLILLLGGTIAMVGFNLSRDMLRTTANDMVGRIGAETGKEIEALIVPAELVINMASQSELTNTRTFAQRQQWIPLLKEALRGSAALSSIYAGYPDGDFFFLRRIGGEAERSFFNAPAGTRFIVQATDHDNGHPIGRYVYLDDDLRTLRSDDLPEYAGSYDPRTRGWFKEAKAATKAIKTAPYLFFSNRKVGITLATASANRNGSVVGADILLETLATDLGKKKLTPRTEIALVNEKGFVLAHEDVEKLVSLPAGANAQPSLNLLQDFGRPALAASARLIGQGAGTTSALLHVGGEDWHVNINAITFQDGAPLYLVVAIPDRELLAAAYKLRTTSLLLTLLVILIAMPVTWLLARRISGSLRLLREQAERIRHFEFSGDEGVRSMVTEVDALSRIMDSMKRTIRRFLDISAAVGGEQDIDRLMPMLLRETLAAAEADFGILYLADNDGLIPMAIVDGHGEELIAPLLPVPLAAAGPLLSASIDSGQAVTGALSADDIAATGVEDLADLALPHHGVAVPLRNRQQHLVGAMLLLRPSPIDATQLSFISNLAVSAAGPLETRELIKAQKELFAAFIKLIAGAIDAKSHYTGAHCARVPEITKMLARAASADNAGPFKDFQLNDSEWEAVHVAAWLHDCGKVTTPEYVIDKATKLETIYDRIHEIRMRFEVLKRDAEIACLRAIAAGADATQARTALAAEWAGIDADFAFIATCNEGGEFMAPEKIKRLRTIAERTWLRTLDDRLGISYEERERKSRLPEQSLPAVENVLADKPEHVFERQPQDRIAENNEWGFRMRVPEKLYDKGELHNLEVARGTLTEEERYKINAHIVQTLIMLSALPFPKHLRQVPELAGGHHEKMDGTGYPRGLKRDEMSPVARMMAIADIFEALTAVDRPYKKGKTLSEAIKIMANMKKDGHIDPEIFDLFLRSGVHLEYAGRFMRPEQIDAVDIQPYLSPSPP